MENRTINLAVVAEVAKALQHLKGKMVFIGGAVISLYTDDPAADEIRPTKDIDMTVILMNLAEWAKMQEELSELGIHPDPHGPSICRYKLKDIPIDIIPAGDTVFGPSNRWYKPGILHLQTVTVHGETIQILPAPYFLGTKLEAFNDRGSDYRTSHDIEDVFYVIDNRITIVKEIQAADTDIRTFIQEEFRKISDAGLMEEVLLSHIHPFVIEERSPIIKEKLESILSL